MKFCIPAIDLKYDLHDWEKFNEESKVKFLHFLSIEV